MKNLLENKYDYDDVEIFEKDTVYQGYFRMQRYKLRYHLFAGGWSKTVSRELFERGNSVVVLPYDPILDKVVLIEQFRISAINKVANRCSPWLFEVVAGVVKENEIIEDVAKREMQEEAGLAIKSLTPIYDYWASPGGSSEYTYFFCAEIDASKAKGLHGLVDEGEDIKVHVISTDDAFALLNKGLIANAHSIIALQWLQIQKNKNN